MKPTISGCALYGWLCLLAVSACSGEISEPGVARKSGTGADSSATGDQAGGPNGPGSSGASASNGAGGSGGPSAVACQQLDVGITPLRRLTQPEYNNTVADLL